MSSAEKAVGYGIVVFAFWAILAWVFSTYRFAIPTLGVTGTVVLFIVAGIGFGYAAYYGARH